jgi:hypothetical protein
MNNELEEDQQIKLKHLVAANADILQSQLQTYLAQTCIITRSTLEMLRPSANVAINTL